MIDLGQPSGDDADDSGVPARSGQHDGATLAHAAGGLDHGSGLVLDLPLDLLASRVAAIELQGDLLGPYGVFGGQHLDGEHGALESSGGIDPRGEHETDRAGIQPPLEETPADLHQRPKARRRLATDASQAMAHHDAVLAGERDHVGDRCQRDQSHRPDEVIAQVG